MRLVPPRLHAILARESDLALLIVRFKTKKFCMVGWSRQKDTFEVGQWLRAVIYPLRSDLSPDGTRFVYFAFDGHRLSQRLSEAYTAVSRSPCLEALALWPMDDTWTGGGLFLDDRTLWVNGWEDSGSGARRIPGLRIVSDPGPPFYGVYPGWEDPRVYVPRLLRDGWTLRGRVERTPDHRVYVFEKPLLDDLLLEKSLHMTSERREQGRGCYYEEHAVLGPGGRRVDHPDWQWADLDAPRRRVAFASGGCLRARPIEPGGAGTASVLFDAKALRFEAHEAPE